MLHTGLHSLTIRNVYIQFLVAFVCLLGFNSIFADEVSILSVDVNHISDDRWQAKVTLKHADSGWDHYADSWRVVDSDGNVLGTRVLYHPHVEEQPFTRQLSTLVIPSTVNTVYIEAHDKLHGWSGNRYKIQLERP